MDDAPFVVTHSTREHRARRLVETIDRAVEYADTPQDLLKSLRGLADAKMLDTTVPLLPFTFKLKGHPYSLKDYFPFEPLFSTRFPEETVLRAGRQVAKSMSLCTSSVMIANALPWTVTLFMQPSASQIQRFSTNYLSPIINEAVFSRDRRETQRDSVFQRDLPNRSKFILSFSSGDAGRTRGISADFIKYDEVQAMDRRVMDNVDETASNSDWSIKHIAGTPTTRDGTLDTFWARSSRAEWFTPCFACGEWSIPSIEHHIVKMIGPARADIGEAAPGLICHKCRRPINPRYGRWHHRVAGKRQECAGYHIPQIIMPMHCMNARKWAKLVARCENRNAIYVHNEIWGEAIEAGGKLITIADLKNAATLPWRNTPHWPSETIMSKCRDYYVLIVAVDWGGGGREQISFTKAAILGASPRGVDCLWGTELPDPHDHIGEADFVYRLWAAVGAKAIAHDFTGAGEIRDRFLLDKGVPRDRILPYLYRGHSGKAMITWKSPTPEQPRGYYVLDRTRSLLYTVTALKSGDLRTFQYDYVDEESTGLLHDFLSLKDEKVHGVSQHRYVIGREAGKSDDFAHAVNLGTAAIWQLNGNWPHFTRDTDRSVASASVLDVED